jgi:hypothetical protein
MRTGGDCLRRGYNKGHDKNDSTQTAHDESGDSGKSPGSLDVPQSVRFENVASFPRAGVKKDHVMLKKIIGCVCTSLTAV